MLVLFISQSQKKAILKTQKILDMYADRIGPTTWKTNITMEGLKVVKKHLSKTASKNTSVACHWIHKSKNTELLWVVGNKNRFNFEGIVPIATTKTSILHEEWENEEHYLDLLKSIIALSALFHDIGKASDEFQKMLNNNESDNIRHEYISYLIFLKFTEKDDKLWLKNCASDNFLEKLQNVSENITKNGIDSGENKRQKQTLLVNLISYLVLSHHLKPNLFFEHKNNEYLEEECDSLDSLLEYINSSWGYQKTNQNDFLMHFSNGIIFSEKWQKEIKKWSGRLLLNYSLLENIDEKISKLLILKARFYLMLGDYYFSSQEKNNNYKSEILLYANTDSNKDLKQFLEEHLLGVKNEALQSIYTIRKGILGFPKLEDDRSLKKKTAKDSKFYWQDKVSKALQLNKEKDDFDVGFFCVNLASTGTGKTFANAKIMNSIIKNDDKSRFIVALGLRSLTLQTGDMYREKMHIDDSDLAVVIGSKAIETLHNLKESDFEEYEESNFYDVDYDNSFSNTSLNTIIKSERDIKFLSAPILVNTIDHIMPSCESTNGGHWLIPILRLSTSDLIIDEIDDFTGNDLIPIAHLVFMMGMLGRKVLISSATITSGIASGFFRAYEKGREIYNSYYNIQSKIITCLVDEFSNSIFSIEEKQDWMEYFNNNYKSFINKRIDFIKRNEKDFGIKRKGELLDFSLNDNLEGVFDEILKSIKALHDDNFLIDEKTKKRISIGMVRFAHIKNCVNFSNYVSQKENLDFGLFKLCYHSRTVLLIRNEIENYLDNVLHRKNQKEQIVDFENQIMRQHIDKDKNQDIIFLVISTPIEEVGRDHDFDWAIIEPSSVRSIIQLVGRVLRHRDGIIGKNNVKILRYNLNSLKNDFSLVFRNPGYEINIKPNLISHDMKDLINVDDIHHSINSIPRLQIINTKDKCKDLNLIELEHYSINYFLMNEESEGPENLKGYYDGYWSLTGLPQEYAPFRGIEPNEKIFLAFDEDDNLSFYIFNDKKEKIPVKEKYSISFIKGDYYNNWLHLDYMNLLEIYSEKLGKPKNKIEEIFGYIEVPKYLLKQGKELSFSYDKGLYERG